MTSFWFDLPLETGSVGSSRVKPPMIRLIKFLRSRRTRSVIHPDAIDFEQQLRAIARTDILVGFQDDPALGLAVFLRPDAFLLELGASSHGVYKSLSGFAGLQHQTVELAEDDGMRGVLRVPSEAVVERVSNLVRIVPGAAQP